MRIGQFAKKNDTTPDTLRHYMDLGLLLVQKKGGQYDFDERAQEDLDSIHDYKAMGFGLKEIRNILWYFRLGSLQTEEEIHTLLGILQEKKEELAEEIEQRKSALVHLDQRMVDLAERGGQERHRYGLPLSFLDQMACPTCGKGFSLSADAVMDNQVYSGKLTCLCESTWTIDEGILIAPRGVIKEERRYSFLSFINETPAVYLNTFVEGQAWFLKHVPFHSFRGKTILELGSGMGLFLRQALAKLPDEARYVAVDYHLSIMRQLKKILERMPRKASLVFVCCDFEDIPLKEGSVEVLIDHAGSSNYSFARPGFLLEKMTSYYGEGTDLLASFIFYDRFGPQAVVPKENRPWFHEEGVLETLEKLGFVTHQLFRGPVISEGGGAHENYLKDKDRIHMLSLIAKNMGSTPRY